MSTKLCFHWHHRFISKQLKPISLNPFGLLSQKHELNLKRPAGLVLYWSIFNGGIMACSLICQCGKDNLKALPYRFFIYTMIGGGEEKVFAHACKEKDQGLNPQLSNLLHCFILQFISSGIHA